jgi:hypothetical protein
MVTALMNSKNPALALETPLGGAVGTNPPIPRKARVPMAVTLEHGVPRVVADDDSTPQFRVPAVINVTALRDALDAQLNGADVTDEVTGVLAMAAGAFAAGMAHQRSLTAVA